MHTNDPLDSTVQHRRPSQVDEFGNVKPQPHATNKLDAEHPGYETTDVNTNGVLVFIGGLVAFLVVFFVLCFGMGKAINYGLLKQDGDDQKMQPHPVSASGTPVEPNKRINLANNPYLEQQESARIARSFPNPRLDVDDGNQSTSDLHAKEDLLLEHSSVDNDGTVRIPVTRAMELIAQKGLGTPVTQTATAQPMAGERNLAVHAPLTTGFARTAYEIEQIESREQKMTLTHESEGERAPAERK